MDTFMKIELDFTNNAFTATATITPDKAINEKTFSFILNKDLVISKIKCNSEKVDYKKTEEVKPEFRPLSQRISIKNNDYIRNIEIEYSGTVAFSSENRVCWHNIITDNLKSLSWYSVWFPQETSITVNHDKVIIKNGRDYFVVKGIYDKSRNVWEYGGKVFDPFNIVMYRKETLKTISNSHMNIFFIDDKIYSQAKKAESIYKDIIDFYNGNLFSEKEIPALDIVCAFPAITSGGGYRRKDFMWCTELGDNDLEIAWLNAHETAHIWCTGADSETWEDWLNETTAEWACLLFAIHKDNKKLFDFILNPKLEKYNSLPPIKTSDNSRPEGVHDKGTVLFYKMYQKFGEESLRLVVRMFTDLEVKNTASLLDVLRSNGHSEIADFIDSGLLI